MSRNQAKQKQCGIEPEHQIPEFDLWAHLLTLPLDQKPSRGATFSRSHDDVI